MAQGVECEALSLISRIPPPQNNKHISKLELLKTILLKFSVTLYQHTTNNKPLDSLLHFLRCGPQSQLLQVHC
jgi:hypothetical protein